MFLLEQKAFINKCECNYPYFLLKNLVWTFLPNKEKEKHTVNEENREEKEVSFIVTLVKAVSGDENVDDNNLKEWLHWGDDDSTLQK